MSYRLRLSRPALKLRVVSRFPAGIAVDNFLTVNRANGTYTFGVDYSLIGEVPVSDPATAMTVVLDQTAGVYKLQSLSSLLVSGLDADIQAIGSLSGSGVLSRTGTNTWALRTLTGTANEITVTNGDGVSGNETFSLPAALTFTGKTVTGGTYNSPTFVTPALGTPSSGTLTNATGLPVSTGISGLAANVAAWLATPSSANLRAALTDETGTGLSYFQGGALGTPASGTLTNATGLPLSGLVAQAAYTFVGNNTGSSAVPTAIDIAALTTKGSPGAGDYVMISDQAASGAWKKTPVSALSGGGSSVSSIAGNTGAFTLSNGITNSANDIRLDVSYVQNFLSGLGLANNGVDATNDIDISPGVAADSTNVALMKLTSALTKQLDAAWAVGTNAGGRMSAAALANGVYFIWLIQRSDTGVVDAGFDLSATAPTMPTNYDRKRRIGAIIRTGGAIKAFIQDGNEFKWVTPVADVNAVGSLGTARITQVVTVPIGIRVKAFGAISLNVDSSTNLRISDLATTDLDPATAVNAQLRVSTSSAINGIQWSVFTDTSAQVGIRLSASGASKFLYLLTEGWIDTRGQ